MSTNLKTSLDAFYQINFPNDLIVELESLKAHDLESAKQVIKTNYIKRVSRYILNDYQLTDSHGSVKFKGSLLVVDPSKSLYSNGEEIKFEDYIGQGAIDALFKAIKNELNKDIEIFHYGSSAITNLASGYKSPVSSEAQVLTLMGIYENTTGKVHWGVGESSNAVRSAIDALLSAINRMDAPAKV